LSICSRNDSDATVLVDGVRRVCVEQHCCCVYETATEFGCLWFFSENDQEIETQEVVTSHTSHLTGVRGRCLNTRVLMSRRVDYSVLPV